jgi:hypothetical protein
MSKGKVVLSTPVVFTPSEGTAKKFKKQNKEKKEYAAIVVEVNDDSVDLKVFGVGEDLDVQNVKHISEAAEGRSNWKFPAQG